MNSAAAVGLQPIAALPMYDFPELRWAHDALWAALEERLITAGVADVPWLLSRGIGHVEVWRHPRLLLGQACEYPLATSLAGSARLVATPCYSAPGCEGSTSRSALVVRADDPAADLRDLRNRRCVINEADSNSGMNLLRAALAPVVASAPLAADVLATPDRTSPGDTFFKSVMLSGSHRRSVAMVVAGEADLAAIDCVSLAHFQRLYPAEVAALRILGWTAPSPSLPFITALSTDETTLRALRSALAGVFTDSALAAARAALLLDGVDLEPDGNLTEVRRLAREAAELGFPTVR